MIFEEGAVRIDAAIIAEGFAIEPALVQPLMREGKITSRYERGAKEDAGRHRLTFFHGKRCLSLVFDGRGNLVERSTSEVGEHRPPTTRLEPGR